VKDLLTQTGRKKCAMMAVLNLSVLSIPFETFKKGMDGKNKYSPPLPKILHVIVSMYHKKRDRRERHFIPFKLIASR